VCHDALCRPLCRCALCGVVLHEECLLGVRGCPTLGCAPPSYWDVTRPRRSRWAVWLAALNYALIVLACCGFGVAGCYYTLRPPWEQQLDAIPDRDAFVRAALEAIERVNAEQDLEPGESVEVELRAEGMRSSMWVRVDEDSVSTCHGGGFGTWGLIVYEDPYPECQSSNSRRLQPHFYIWWSD